MIIYVFQLENDKYYIGSTLDMTKKLEAFESGIDNTPWTDKNKFIAVLETFQGDKFDEDKTVLRYMEEFGIDNVRGGIYNEVELSFDQYITIKKFINNSNGFCTACGREGHKIKDCRIPICYRCGRLYHSSSNCNETTHIYNGRLDGCYRCGRSDHSWIRCNRTKDVYGRIIEKSCIIS